MLGFVGFILAAAAITSFIWSAQKVYTTVDSYQLKAFSVAFGCLAVAMLLWAVVAISNDDGLTQNFMLASDVMLLLGTASMVLVIVNQFSSFLLVGLGAITAMLTSYRAYTQPPTAYVHDGLLYFNLQGSSRLFIVGMFAFIWLPAMIIVANKVANHPLLTNRRYSLMMYFVLLVALTAMFAKAQRSAAIIVLFGLIIFVFLLSTVFNVVLAKAQDSMPIPAKRSKPRAARV